MSSLHRVRPFGPLSWILEKLPATGPWSIIGALSAEDRCLTATQETLRLSTGTTGKLLNITPRVLSSTRPTRPAKEHAIAWEQKRILNLRRVEVELEFRSHIVVVDAGSFLQQEDSKVNDMALKLAEESPSDVVLDVSTMPKRYFFPLLTRLCESNHVRNLIVTNTSPLRYGDELAGDSDGPKPLPLYEGEPEIDQSPDVTLIIGVGYHQLNIQQILEENKSRRVDIKLLFPFPSIHPGFIQNWRFVEHINKHRPRSAGNSDASEIDIIRVPVGDVSLTFDRLLQQTQDGKMSSLILAPYGPKPMSLAMCLLGVARRAKGINPDNDAQNLPTKISYTQPSWYHPDYSSGIRRTNGVPDITAFCIRLNGRDLYVLP